MIALALAVLMQVPAEDDVFLRFKGGLWSSGGFEFQTLTPTGTREIDGKILGHAGVEAGAVVYEGWMVNGGFDFSWANDVELTSANVGVGYRMRVDEFIDVFPPFYFEISAGGLWGQFEVDEPGFGEFEDGWGFRAGATFVFEITKSIALGGWVDGRWIRFEYEEDTLEGDKFAGGGGVTAGLTLELSW